MAKAVHLFEDFQKSKSSKTYATYASAVKAADKILSEIQEDHGIWVIIGATPEGRYHPIFKLHPHQSWYLGFFAHSGFCVTL